MGKAKPTRERLVEAALYLFWLQGYAATGIAQILDRAEAKAGSFYYFFKTKEDLLMAVLDLYVQSLEPVVVRPVFDELSDPCEQAVMNMRAANQHHADVSTNAAGAH